MTGTKRRLAMVLPILAGAFLLAASLRERREPVPPSRPVQHRPLPASPVPDSSPTAPLEIRPSGGDPAPKTTVATAPPALPATVSSPAGAVPTWAAEPSPEVAARLREGRESFLKQIGEELSLTEAQHELLRLAYRDREDEVTRTRVEARAGRLSRDAYYRQVESANDRLYDRLEAGLSRDQTLLLQRFRRQSRQAVAKLRAES